MTEDASRRANHDGTPDWDAIARYLAGESSGEEAARVARWLDAHPADKELVERLTVNAVVETPADIDIDGALRRVHERMNDAPATRPRLTIEQGGARRSRTIAYTAIAAAAAAAFVAVLSNGRDTPTPTQQPAAAQVYSTTTGKRDSIRLADGSRVILGPESRLTVPGDFSAAGRAVTLEGDAYFDVVHDVAKPFTVRVANAIVEDVGTTFTVETDPSNTTTVSVLSGVVRLSPVTAPASGSSGALLSAGDRGVLTSDGGIRAQKKVVVADDSAWTTGKLVFRDASMARVASELRRWYGLRLGIADSSLLRRTVSTTLTEGQSVDEVLDILSLTLGARVERKGDSATIHAGRGSNTVR